MKKFLTVLLVIAVMFTFSFSSAFAYVPYEADKTDVYIAQVEDFYGYNATTATKNGTFGITELERARLVYELNAKLDAVDGVYAAPAQAKVDAAIKEALDAVKAAKTNKEATVAMDAYKKVLADNADYTYAKLKEAFEAGKATASQTVAASDDDKVAGGTKVTVTLDETGVYNIPDFGAQDAVITGDVYTVLANEAGSAAFLKVKSDAAFNYLMDKGLYGYTTYAAWKKALTGKDAKAYVEGYVNPYWIGTVTVQAAVDNPSTNYANLSSYGKSLYMEYTGLLNAVDTFNNTVAIPSIDEVTALIDKLDAFNDKYDAGAVKFTKTNTSTAPAAKYQLDGRRVGIAAESWNATNLDAATTALGKINTTSGYVAAKADILAAAKTMFATVEKYDDYMSEPWNFVKGAADSVLVNTDDVAQIVKALEVIMIEEGNALKKAQDYTEKVLVTGNRWDFDASAENVAALENARKLYDAYYADYANAYAFVATYATALSITPSASLLPNGTLKDYEAKLLAGEYNKAKTAEYKGDADKIEKNYVQSYLNNATVKVTTTALGNNKIRVQAKVDTQSFEKILGSMKDGWTVSYKFYHKTAAGKTYKAAKEKNRNYITYTKLSLKKGVKYKFRCAVIVKDENGNVVATKDYKASTVGSRVCR